MENIDNKKTPVEIINNKIDWNKKIKTTLTDNIVVIIFVALCLICIQVAQMPMSFIINELVSRLSRNLFLVLSLIIPVLAGMGLNFGIVIGAMAGQIALIAVTHWGITGLAGFSLAVAITIPISIVFGYLTGVVLNKTRGQEMIAGMILGYFTNGLYQLLFLFLVGTIIPMNNPVLVLSGGVGIKNTIDLNSIKYALDRAFDPFFKITFVHASMVICIVLIALFAYGAYKNKKEDRYEKYINALIKAVIFVVIFGLLIVLSQQKSIINMIKFPTAAFLVIALICIFTKFIMATKLGQDFRTVGQDMHVAEVSGINVNKTRIKAIMISTVLAGVGQLIFLQNIGTLNTYGGHEQVGMYAIAALLVGGASVSKATIGQAIIGTALFHTLFIVSPQAGQNLFGNAQIGEYFRVFVAYGVIGISLALYAWKQVKARKDL
ncbi:ABC transporter permease subunit [Proteocatella sphenisci]|uniref:ABC transporter permease subunit n=1 Tax=Proteocatella sphenisci TaxID=181070 RepID=UPI0004B5BF1D|nr:ABC transporter permease [Proteocatella sphenisci]